MNWLLSKILTSQQGAGSICCGLLKMKVCSSSVRTARVQLLNLVLSKSHNFVKLTEDSTLCRNTENTYFTDSFSIF